jgi:hypothetical protein
MSLVPLLRGSTKQRSKISTDQALKLGGLLAFIVDDSPNIEQDDQSWHKYHPPCQKEIISVKNASKP